MGPLERRLADVAPLYAQVFLPVAPGALADDHLFVGMADRKLVFRHVGVLPHAAALALLALVDDPVVVALIHDVPLGSVHRRRADAAVELPPQRDLPFADLRRLALALVAGLLELLARHRGEDLLVAQAEL